jgi:thiol-disulfide isomerase/thioredoxin
LILVILLGGSDDDNEKIIVMPPAPAPAAVSASRAAANCNAAANANAGHQDHASKAGMNGSHGGKSSAMGKIRELTSAAEALELLSSKQPALVLFYANFCGHCTRMMPDFEQAAAEAGDKSGIIIARVESGSLKDMSAVGSKLPSVSGFPTSMTNYEGGIKTHVGRLDKQAIVALMKTGNGTRIAGGVSGSGHNMHAEGDKGSNKPGKRVIKEFQSWKEACDALQSDKKTIVMAYADWCGYCKTMMPDYEKLLEKAPKDVTVARINADNMTQAEVCNGDKGMIDVIRGFPTILYNGGGKLILKVVGRQTLKSLTDIVEGKKQA